jgi:hypothetical protein
VTEASTVHSVYRQNKPKIKVNLLQDLNWLIENGHLHLARDGRPPLPTTDYILFPAPTSGHLTFLGTIDLQAIRGFSAYRWQNRYCG